jgi:hypothetical protein
VALALRNGTSRCAAFRERLSLELWGDGFNVINHANIGSALPDPQEPNSLFGYAAQTLNDYQAPAPVRRPQPPLPDWRPALDPTALKLQF